LYLQHLVLVNSCCYLSLATGTEPNAVNTVTCAPDDGWRNHPKHVEQFTGKINCVKSHLVGHLLTQNYDARSHEHKILGDRDSIPAKDNKILIFYVVSSNFGLYGLFPRAEKL